MRFDEVLRVFASFFEHESIPYAVIGGLALHAWGLSRFTRDIDMVVPRAERDRIVSRAESLGFETLQDVHFLLKLPWVNRDAARDFFARHGLLEVFDAIERNS